MVSARRRKGKDEDPLLPTTNNHATNGHSKKLHKKRNRARALSRLIARAVSCSVILLIIVAAYPIFFPEAPHAQKIKAHWHKLAAFVKKKRQAHLLHKQQQQHSEKDGGYTHKHAAAEEVSVHADVRAAKDSRTADQNEDEETEDDDFTLEALIAQNTPDDDSHTSALTDTGCHESHIHEISQQEANPPGICINDPSLLPKRWRAPAHLDFVDDGSPWTDVEQALAEEAATKGLDELVDFFDTASDDRIRELGIDAMNSLMDYVFGSGDVAVFHQKAVDTAIRVLHISAAQLVGERTAEYASECSHMYPKVKLTGYAHRLHHERPANEDLEELRNQLISMLNDSFEECSSDLDEVLENDDPWTEMIKDKSQPEEEVYSWAMWAIALTECLVMVEDLTKLPEDTPDFVAEVWRYMEHYDIPDHRDYVHEEDEDERGTWVEFAYLATHLQFIPTGYGRHYHYVEDAPYLYHFYRDNFYAAFSHGGHNLVAEFIHLLSTYGCTVHNDLQLRHGVRYMLHLYKEAGHSFVNHREAWESQIINDYEKVHKPWKGIASVMTHGCFEPEIPGSYGYAFRQALNVVPDEEGGEDINDDATYKEEE